MPWVFGTPWPKFDSGRPMTSKTRRRPSPIVNKSFLLTGIYEKKKQIREYRKMTNPKQLTRERHSGPDVFIRILNWQHDLQRFCLSNFLSPPVYLVSGIRFRGFRPIIRRTGITRYIGTLQTIDNRNIVERSPMFGLPEVAGSQVS